MYYDIEKIKEDATPIGILKYLSKPCVKSGNSLFIECPTHKKVLGKVDQHISNCVINVDDFDKAFYCHGCNTSGSGFDMIAGYLDLDLQNDFSEILRIAGESCGGSEYYVVENSQQTKKTKNKNLEDFRLTSEELALLGLKDNIFSTKYISSFDESLLSDDYQLTKDTNLNVYNDNALHKISYLESTASRQSLNSLPKTIYLYIIKDTILKKMDLYKRLVMDDKLAGNELFAELTLIQKQSISEGLKNVFRQKYLKVKSCFLKVASPEEILPINDSWLYDFDIIDEELKPDSLF